MSIQINNSNFVHCHVHSEYSNFDGLIPIKKLVNKARFMGFPALAITDHGTIGGWIKFIQACTATVDKDGKELPYLPIKPILGIECYLCKNMSYKSKALQPEGRKGNSHLILLAKNWDGYKNICFLSQASWVDGFYSHPRIDFEMLNKHSSGVIASSACLGGIINANLLRDRYEQAKKAAIILKDIFKEDFFLEVMFHGMEEQKLIISDILKLGKELNIPVIASNDVHFLEKEHAESQEVLMCMSTNKCMKDSKRMRHSYPEYYLKSAKEMYSIFKFCPQVLYNTLSIAERVQGKEIINSLFGGMKIPRFIVPKEYKNPYDYLSFLAYEGLKKLGWDKSQKHVDALKMELGDIKVAYDNNGYDFSTYFLVVWDIINHAKKVGILTGPGRGSGYGSVILRCIGATYGPDPIKYGLIWERFLGFEKKRFIAAKDFGFDSIDKQKDLPLKAIEERSRNEDPGGVDRY